MSHKDFPVLFRSWHDYCERELTFALSESQNQFNGYKELQETKLTPALNELQKRFDEYKKLLTQCTSIPNELQKQFDEYKKLQTKHTSTPNELQKQFDEYKKLQTKHTSALNKLQKQFDEYKKLQTQLTSALNELQKQFDECKELQTKHTSAPNELQKQSDKYKELQETKHTPALNELQEQFDEYKKLQETKLTLALNELQEQFNKLQETKLTLALNELQEQFNKLQETKLTPALNELQELKFDMSSLCRIVLELSKPLLIESTDGISIHLYATNTDLLPIFSKIVSNDNISFSSGETSSHPSNIAIVLILSADTRWLEEIREELAKQIAPYKKKMFLIFSTNGSEGDMGKVEFDSVLLRDEGIPIPDRVAKVILKTNLELKYPESSEEILKDELAFFLQDEFAKIQENQRRAPLRKIVRDFQQKYQN